MQNVTELKLEGSDNGICDRYDNKFSAENAKHKKH